MASTEEILHDFSPFFRVLKCGQVERLVGNNTVPASVDPATGVRSKDVKINAESGVSARLYLPKSVDTDHKLPLLVYFHGGGFVIETAFSPLYHTYLNNLVAEANIIVVSVDYRRAPEHPLPTAYEDSWDAILWAASHSSGNGQEPWLNEYANFRSVFFGGDSAGGNIAHNMAMLAGSEKLDGMIVEGIVLVHAYFWGKEPVGGEPVDQESRAFNENLWLYANPGSSGIDDPLVNPGSDPKISNLGCKRVIVLVAEKDSLKHRGVYYKELLEESGWGGKVKFVESKDEDHVFHLFTPTSYNAVSLVKSVASFMNEGKTE
ncbi:Arylacetamide deacetylase [Heracleum sosnowskyi]|uniref:Arylacetamide deacetylase n=1 Tax=Heracleum sosnowskyi TaxID=360622 RepID=A0AAD8JDJ6_9APIA|nr:Arylacetamide deacetylase [Heracleum sosnowskyi]